MATYDAFKRTVWDYYRRHRRDFPWRRTRDPYRILVSEIMLQQTQTDRVVSFYKKFLRRFPSFQTLATSPLRDVLGVWSGLGYNRRALYLKRTAEIIMRDYKGRLPTDPDVLGRLPGIGHYTAAAVACFAFGRPTVFIETNIRTVYLRHFIPPPSGGRIKERVHDSALLPYIKKTLDTKRPRDWYYALMDYGAYLKKTLGTNPNRRSAHHARQTPFHGSLREVRGAIMKSWTRRRTHAAIIKKFSRRKVAEAVRSLKRDGLLAK